MGIGASAGGLDAFRRLLRALPVRSGAAFVFVPHLDPSHESSMAGILSHDTAMPVSQIASGLEIQPDHVYVLPPNAYLTLSGTALQLNGPMTRAGPQTSIDVFLRSLAKSAAERAVCVILSGTGSHGSLGLKAVKEGGGLVMVQAPETAEFDQMPRAAIATGLADEVLPPEKIAGALVRYLGHPLVHGTWSAEEGTSLADLTELLTWLRESTGRDFTSYRPKMLQRRVARRMALRQVESFRAYAELVKAQPDEARALARDFLLRVTSFFRDPEAFDVLRTRVIPELAR